MNIDSVLQKGIIIPADKLDTLCKGDGLLIHRMPNGWRCVVICGMGHTQQSEYISDPCEKPGEAIGAALWKHHVRPRFDIVEGPKR